MREVTFYSVTGDCWRWFGENHLEVDGIKSSFCEDDVRRLMFEYLSWDEECECAPIIDEDIMRIMQWGDEGEPEAQG